MLADPEARPFTVPVRSTVATAGLELEKRILQFLNRASRL